MNDDDNEAIERLMISIEDAWQRHDADDFISNFAEDCTYVTGFGHVCHGRKQVAEFHRALWQGELGGTRIFQEILDTHFPSDGTAIVVTRGELSRRKPRPGRLNKILSYVATRHPEGWLFDHVQHTSGHRLIDRITALVAHDARGPTGTGILMP